MDGSKGQFTLMTEDGEAVMTFSILSPHRIIVDHTATPDGGRGKGYGKRLFDHLVEYARSNEIKITPLCPFVNAQRRKHPDWADAFQV